MSTLSSSDSRFYDGVPDDQTAEVREGRSTLTNAALVGAAAGLTASGMMLWAATLWGGSTLPQLIAERTTAELPLSVVREGIGRLEENAKPLTLVGITIGQVILAAIVGMVYARVARPGVPRRVLGAGVLSIATWLALSLIAAPLGGIGLFGSDSSQGVMETQLTFAVSSATFGVLLALFVPWPEPMSAESSSRRAILRTGALATLAVPAVVAAAYVGRQANNLRTSFDVGGGVITEDDEESDDDEERGPFQFAGMPEFYTPIDAFYVVSKNIVDPTVNSAEWSLEVTGMVDNPMTLSYSDILLRDTTEMASTLECISNSVGGSYISNTIWTGFPLHELLEEAGLQDGVVDIRMEAADGYSESIPLAEAMQDDTMLVYLMDGEPLTDEHGAPLRLIVPNIYGMKNVKWITKIEPVDFDYMGYWQERDWSDVATVLTMSRIDTVLPGKDVPLGKTLRLGGVAFAGDRGISKVELSLDDGETWNEAQLSEVPSGRTWRLWRYDFLAEELGIYRLVVRATDGDGVLQDETERRALPDGSTGWHRSWFEVVEPEDA